MKTRLLIIIGIIPAIAISIIYVSLAYNQEIKLATGMMTGDEKPQPSMVSDPVCFVVDRSSSGETGSGVTLDRCFTLSKFEEMGCTKPMLEHLAQYSNLLDYESDGTWYLKFIGLPSGMSVEDFERCVDVIKEMRLILDSSHNDKPKTTGFSQRYHISVLQNPKTIQQYIDPDFITIGPGDKVTWSNYDKTPTTISSNDSVPPWNTGIILQDGYATITFNKTGIYEYRGNPGTHGFIVVVDDDGQLLESKFSEVFGPGSPLVYNEGIKPVFLYDNCKRYVYWLNEHGHEKITIPEDYPRYPPWGNQIFPLVEFCISNGNIVNVGDENSIRWEFKMEHEN